MNGTQVLAKNMTNTFSPPFFRSGYYIGIHLGFFYGSHGPATVSFFDQDLSVGIFPKRMNRTIFMVHSLAHSNSNKGQNPRRLLLNPNWPYDWRQYVVIDDYNFKTAVNLWFDNQEVANATYGHISDWNTSAVTNMVFCLQRKNRI